MAPSNEPTFSIVNVRTGQRLADRARSARHFVSRSKGLLGVRILEAGRGLLIPRCNAIHTCFMQIPIDVVFVDRQNHVLRSCAQVTPFRIVWGGWKARTVIELPTGTIQRTDTQPGDILQCQPNFS